MKNILDISSGRNVNVSQHLSNIFHMERNVGAFHFFPSKYLGIEFIELPTALLVRTSETYNTENININIKPMIPVIHTHGAGGCWSLLILCFGRCEYWFK